MSASLDFPALLAAAQALSEPLVAWRRHLHSFPELSGQELETGKFVAQHLAQIGLTDIQTEFAQTCAVIARIQGDQPGPVVALRADLDALPIEEGNEVPYVSQHPGVMHACGHDVHTAVLLGAAQLLWERRSQIKGQIRLIFQPAEERSDCKGASHLIQAGVLLEPPVEAIFGLHVYPDLTIGTVATRPGPMMASADIFQISLKGKGSHAARPHHGIDPILMAAQAVNALHQLVSRRVDPFQPAVLTIGYIHGGVAENVIPETVSLGGTVRTLCPQLREQFPRWIEDLLRGLVNSHGGSFELDYQYGTAPVVNHPGTTEYAFQTLGKLLGQEQVLLLPEPSMGGEDFGAYLQAIPGTFLRLGVRSPNKPKIPGLHNPHFDIDERALPVGAAALTALALGWPNRA
ncbi:MAG: M20 family metallopeptidase [Candidatus Sericytochromatia bacterium]